jgi:hypothetical protein
MANGVRDALNSLTLQGRGNLISSFAQRSKHPVPYFNDPQVSSGRSSRQFHR